NSQVLAREHSPNDVSRFKIYVPPTAAPTRPYWHRNDPETDALNTIDDPQYANLALPPPPVKAIAFVEGAGMISGACMVRYKDSAGSIAERPLSVAPAFSVLLDPGSQVVPQDDGFAVGVNAVVSSNLETATLSQTRWTGDPEENEGNLRIQ